jgi:hypothetical protein
MLWLTNRAGGHLSSVLAEILAYLSIVAYTLIVRVVNGGTGVLIIRHPSPHSHPFHQRCPPRWVF